jgi:hypothetical protein
MKPIADMKAGTQIDALVAVKVLGWTPVTGDWWPHAVNSGQFNCPLDKADGFAHVYSEGGLLMPDGKTYCSKKAYNWRPSERIEDAWEVVTASNAVFELFWNPIRKKWAAKFMGSGEFSIGETAPLAICRAALTFVNAIEPIL